MLYYHVSSEDRGPLLIVKDLHLPKKGYGEPEIPRFSMAPTVAQCILGAPCSGKLFIYEFEVTRPIKTDQTFDHAIVDEYLITEEVLKRHGGEICGKYAGFVNVRGDLSTALKIMFHGRDIKVSAEEEKVLLWKLVGKQWTFSHWIINIS